MTWPGVDLSLRAGSRIPPPPGLALVGQCCWYTNPCWWQEVGCGMDLHGCCLPINEDLSSYPSANRFWGLFQSGRVWPPSASAHLSLRSPHAHSPQASAWTSWSQHRLMKSTRVFSPRSVWHLGGVTGYGLEHLLAALLPGKLPNCVLVLQWEGFASWLFYLLICFLIMFTEV